MEVEEAAADMAAAREISPDSTPDKATRVLRYGEVVNLQASSFTRLVSETSTWRWTSRKVLEEIRTDTLLMANSCTEVVGVVVVVVVVVVAVVMRQRLMDNVKMVEAVEGEVNFRPGDKRPTFKSCTYRASSETAASRVMGLKSRRGVGLEAGAVELKPKRRVSDETRERSARYKPLEAIR